MKEIIIKKEDAVFWLDKSGCWCNDGGKFRKKKIIDFFHHSIAKDDDGYFVSQVRDDVFEKVYFRYEDTALFVFEVIFNDDIVLKLNTGKQLPLVPSNLYIMNDNLYMTCEDETLKFSERALVQISSIIREDKDNREGRDAKDSSLVLHWKGNKFHIMENPNQS